MEMSGCPHAPATLSPGESPDTRWVGGWGAPKPVWTVSEKRESVTPFAIWTPDLPLRTYKVLKATWGKEIRDRHVRCPFQGAGLSVSTVQCGWAAHTLRLSANHFSVHLYRSSILDILRIFTGPLCVLNACRIISVVIVKGKALP
jgi:hypothetical protein